MFRLKAKVYTLPIGNKIIDEVDVVSSSMMARLMTVASTGRLMQSSGRNMVAYFLEAEAGEESLL